MDIQMTQLTENRVIMIEVRVTGREKALLQKRAVREGMGVSTFMRVRMLEYCENKRK